MGTISRPTRRAFTLIEVLVVVAIIALLVAVLLPSLAAARHQAASVVCRTRLRELYNGHLFYSQEYKQFFPQYEWWLWDCHPTSWNPGESLAWYTGGHVYDKSGGTWWADSSRWVEYGHIYKYVKDKEVYFCPRDRKRRMGVAIGAGGPNCGSKPITSYTRLLETHNLALGHAQGGIWGNSQAADNAPTDFLSIDRIKPANLAKVAPPGLGQYVSTYLTRKFATTPDRIALLFEEWPNGEGEDTLGRADPGALSNQYISMDNATSFPTVGDYMAMRHLGRSNFVYWDGHVGTTRKGSEPNLHANGYAGEVLFGAGHN